MHPAPLSLHRPGSFDSKLPPHSHSKCESQGVFPHGCFSPGGAVTPHEGTVYEALVWLQCLKSEQNNLRIWRG
jgi:hypothetical protein